MVFNLNKKGQLSLEFLMILLVILVLIETIILPLRNYAEDSVKDMLALNYLENDLINLKTAYDKLNLYDSGQLKVNLTIPENSKVYLIDNNLSYDLNIFSEDLNNICPNKFCTKTINLELNGAFDYNINKDITLKKENGVVSVE